MKRRAIFQNNNNDGTKKSERKKNHIHERHSDEVEVRTQHSVIIVGKITETRCRAHLHRGDDAKEKRLQFNFIQRIHRCESINYDIAILVHNALYDGDAFNSLFLSIIRGKD